MEEKLIKVTTTNKSISEDVLKQSGEWANFVAMKKIKEAQDNYYNAIRKMREDQGEKQ